MLASKGISVPALLANIMQVLAHRTGLIARLAGVLQFIPEGCQPLAGG